MEGYTQVWDYMTNAIDPNVIQRNSDGAFIPNDLGNTDWMAYLEWLAAGGIPDPPPNMPAPPSQDPPVNITPPFLSALNPVIPLSIISCDFGIWTGSPDLTFQWLTSPGATPIEGATTGAYIAQPADVGNRISCEVFGANEYGSASVISSNAIPIMQPPPVNIRAPRLSGMYGVRQPLTCDGGGWLNNPTWLYYQWVRDGMPIADALDYEYYLVEADAGTTVACEVIASNNGGWSALVSSPLLDIPAAPPKNISPPLVSINPTYLLCTGGEWTNNPNTMSYLWLANGKPVDPPGGSTWQFAGYEGMSVVCAVGVTNVWGACPPVNSNAVVVPG